MTKKIGSEAKRRGNWGEAAALAFLTEKNYYAIALGYYCRYGEIDIIAAHEGFIVFVEVKLRKNRDFGLAREYVSLSKQRKIRTTALSWLSENETDLQPRFDVIEIYAPDGVKTVLPEIIHIEDAF